MSLFIDKKCKLFIVLVCFAWQVQAQQQPMFSHYWVNGLAINPAYAGSRDRISGVLTYRNQWSQVNGAPVTQTLGLHAPVLNKKMGVGINIVNDAIGISKNLSITSAYSYRLKLAKGILQMGLQASIYNFRNNWTEIETTQENDPSFSLGDESFWKPNFGVGAFWKTSNYFIGLSIPILVPHNLNSNNTVNGAKLYQHYFLTSGALFNISPKLDIKPLMMVKYVNGAPIQFDANAMLIFNKAFWFGGGLRSRDGIIVSMQYHTRKSIWLGYSYEYPLTDLSLVTNGSHEIFIGLDYHKVKAKIFSPRYF